MCESNSFMYEFSSTVMMVVKLVKWLGWSDLDCESWNTTCAPNIFYASHEKLAELFLVFCVGLATTS